jgi:hypothetical protein
MGESLTKNTELFVMRAPLAAYRRLAPDHQVSFAGAMRRPAVAAIAIGTAASILATERVTLTLVLTTTLCWSFIVVVQLFAGLVLIARSRSSIVARAPALDLLFMGHGPWSLWLLAVAAWTAWFPRPESRELIVLGSAIVPWVWTVTILFSFCTIVMRASRREAIVGILLHQFIVWTVAVMYVDFAVALRPRILGNLPW